MRHTLRHAASLALLPVALAAQSATPTAFVTTIGKDTFCLEQYTRTGNMVSGTWVVLHPPGVYVHDYHITLNDAGLPTRYTMKYSTPGSPTPADLDSLIVIYGRDSATLTFVMSDSSYTRRLAMHEAYPLLGSSFVGVELALTRLRRMHVDSATITLHPPSQPSSPITVAPVKFFGADSALVGPNVHVRVAPDGSILGLRSGPAELRRAAPLDIAALTDGFVKAFAPRMAALATAAASRVEIALPAEQMARFVGEYSIAAATVTVTRDGDHLLLHLPQQPPLQLLAMSSHEFFVRKPDFVVGFDVDASGTVTALTIGQGEAKQRLPKTK
jgi:Domain of unknown function (DUF3471)